MSLKKQYGNIARLTANFDVNFLNVLLHAVEDKQPNIIMCRCAASPLKKRSIMAADEITDRLATANLLLLSLNAEDDKRDEGRGKVGLASAALKKAVKKAKQAAPQLDDALRRLYEGLTKAEDASSSNIDEVCDFSCQILVETAQYALGKQVPPLLKSLCYNTGKWIYLIDALDDLKKDAKHKVYNPLIAWLGDFETEKQFVKNNRESLEFIFFATLNNLAANFNDLRLNSFFCILKNIIYESMRQKTSDILDKYIGGNKNDFKTSV